MNDLASLNLIGKSPAFLAALGLIKKFAGCDATTLILGETGTGKELAARAIHYFSSRRDLPFIPVNCGALPDSLVESELFGHSRGAFTDAKEETVGLVAQAKGGTLFLDEVEAMSPRAQVVLLRFLQDKEYRPVGGKVVKHANLRVVAASNADLDDLVARGLFRIDLVFRLNVLSLHLPRLRDRTGDAVVLAQAFLDRLNATSHGPHKILHPDSRALLDAHRWPGNVRELENLITREYLLASNSTIHLASLLDSDKSDATLEEDECSGNECFHVAKARAIAHFERSYITALLSETGGNISQAARLAGKDRSDITKLVKKYGLDREHFLVRSSP